MLLIQIIGLVGMLAVFVVFLAAVISGIFFGLQTDPLSFAGLAYTLMCFALMVYLPTLGK